MNLQEQKTWQTLQNLAIDDKCASFKFSDRLARENGWSKKFALQCIEEYKKFVFLAKHAGHPVTPSLEVDEAWHLHMIYTRSYWEEMCKEIEFQLHHGPTKGGKAEDVKFTDWYAKTKDSYRKFFGEPPSAFWPSSEIRFSPQDVVQILQDVAQVLQDVALALQVAALLAAEVVAANWSGGREVRRRSAKPYTIVRFNPGPHKKKLSVFTESFYIKKPLKLLSKISSLNFSWKTYLI